MSVSMRLQRFGAHNQPHMRIVVQDKTRARSSKVIEQVGIYEPCENPPKAILKKERVEYWLSVGAQPSNTVGNILKKQGIGVKAKN